MFTARLTRSKANPANETLSSTNPSMTSMSRPRRAGAAMVSTHATPSITVSRSPSGSPEEKRKSIRLTVKMPASKLREVTSGGSTVSTRGGGDLPHAAEVRSSTRPREKKRYAEYEEDEDEDDDEGEEDEEEDDEDDEEAEADSDAEVDELTDDRHEDEDGDGDTDGDIEMGDAPVAPPPGRYSASGAGPKITLKTAPKPQVHQPVNPSLIVTPAPITPFQSVEEKEMELDEDEDEDEDEELSELESDAEEEELDETALGEEEDVEDDEDAEGEEDKLGGEGAGSDEEAGSGASTPDYAKMTKRQRGHLQDEGGFLALPMEPQIKKILTADEHRMRRVEMARRRKNLSEKRNEEEKVGISPLNLRRATFRRH